MSTTLHRVKGILRWPEGYPKKIKYCEGIVTGITDNVKTFATPSPTMNVVSGALTLLNTAEVAAATHAIGTAAARDAQWLVVLSLFEQVLAYVQGIADNAGSPAQATLVFQLAGIDIEKEHVQPHREFKAAQKISTVVELTTPSYGDNTAIIWEYGTAPTALTSWMVTIHGKLSLPNQTPGTVLYVRHRVVTTKGYQDWSQTITHTVT